MRAIGSSLGSARRAQENAVRREDFDGAMRYRDEAREAEVWLGQTVRDAPVRPTSSESILLVVVMVVVSVSVSVLVLELVSMGG